MDITIRIAKILPLRTGERARLRNAVHLSKDVGPELTLVQDQAETITARIGSAKTRLYSAVTSMWTDRCDRWSRACRVRWAIYDSVLARPSELCSLRRPFCCCHAPLRGVSGADNRRRTYPDLCHPLQQTRRLCMWISRRSLSSPDIPHRQGCPKSLPAPPNRAPMLPSMHWGSGP